MARTNEDDVKDVIDTVVGTDAINAYIATANVLVDKYLSGAGLGASLLEEIEKYLAAHLVTLQDPRLMSLKTDEVTEKYQRPDGAVSKWLGIAVSLDPTGKLEDRLMPEGRQSVSFRMSKGYDGDLDLPKGSA